MSKTRCVVFLPDMHFPYHDEAAVATAMRAVEAIKPHTVVVLGDMLDAHAFSAHSVKSLEEAKIHDFKATELDPANEILTRLACYATRVVFVEGNHEARCEAASARTPSLRAVHGMFSPRAHLGSHLNKRQFTYVPYGSDFKRAFYRVTPRLIAVHGLSHAKAATSAHLDRVPGFSVVHGHTHRAQMDTRRNPITDEVASAHSFGCLSRLEPLYMHGKPTNWVHGFGVGYIRRDDSHSIYHVPIHEGSAVLPNGRLVRG